MSSSLLWITFVGETEGERKRIFTTIETDNLGEVKHLEQIKKISTESYYSLLQMFMISIQYFTKLATSQ